MPLRPLLFAAALVVALAGCPTDPAGPAIQIGTGEPGEEFVPLAGGEVLFVTQGPQGCCHVWGSLRVSGIEAGNPDDVSEVRNPTMEFELLVEGASIVSEGDATQGLETAPASAAPYTHEFIGRRVLLDILNDDAFEDGVDAVFSVSVDDVEGIHLSASVDVLLEPHPFNE